MSLTSFSWWFVRVELAARPRGGLANEVVIGSNRMIWMLNGGDNIFMLI
jgi:hypothetical protein